MSKKITSTITVLDGGPVTVTIVAGTPGKDVSHLPFCVRPGEGPSAWFLNEEDALKFAQQHAIATVWCREGGGWTQHPYGRGFNGRGSKYGTDRIKTLLNRDERGRFC